MEQELDIEFHEGIPCEETINKYTDGQEHTILCIDDLMETAISSVNVHNLFTKFSHHKNITIIYLNQNMFCQGKYARSLNLNTHWMIVLRNPRDTSQIATLGKQTGFGNTLKEAYRDATSKPYGYLVIDLSPHREENYCLKTNIFPNDDQIVYMPI